MSTAPPPAPPARIPAVWMWIAMGVFGLSLFIQLHHMLDWYQRGGSPWAQGDWLINLGAGPIRRGPFGEALLWLATASGIPILPLLMGLQLALTVALYGLAAGLVWRQREPAALLAVFSAAFFVFLIGAGPASGLRKELLCLVAILLIAAPGGGTGRMLLSALLLAASAVGHELGVLALPAWLLALWLLRPGQLGGWPVRAIAAGATLVVAAAALYAIRFPHLDGVEPVCAAIRAAGPVSDEICDGAIAWLTDTEGGTTRVIEVLDRIRDQLALSLLAMLLSVVPLGLLLWLCRPPRRIVLALVAAVAPFCLLYPLGYDWGRWLSLQYSIAAFLTLGLLLRGVLTPARPFNPLQLWLWLGLAMATGMNLFITPVPLAFPLMVVFATLTML